MIHHLFVGTCLLFYALLISSTINSSPRSAGILLSDFPYISFEMKRICILYCCFLCSFSSCFILFSSTLCLYILQYILKLGDFKWDGGCNYLIVIPVMHFPTYGDSVSSPNVACVYILVFSFDVFGIFCMINRVCHS